MNALDCTDIKALLSALIDDQLDEHTRHQVERHLAECDACRAQVNEHERLDALVAMSAELAAHGSPELPRGFEQQVLAQTVRAEEERSPSVVGRIGMWTGWFAAAASLAVAVVIWTSDQPARTPEGYALDRPAPAQDSGTAIARGEATKTEDATVEEYQIAARPESPPDPLAVETTSAQYATGANLRSSTSDAAFDSPEQLRPSARPDRQRTGTSYAPILGSPQRFSSFDAGLAGSPFRTISHQYTLPVAHSADDSRPARRAPAISRDEADTIYSVALLMNVLADADLESFADIERIRRVVEADDLIERLADAREGLDAADRPAALAAEAVLVRIFQGPLDRADVRELRETAARLELSAEMSDITRRWDQAHSL